MTVLTGFGHQDRADLGYQCPLADLGSLRVHKAMEAGMDYVVRDGRSHAQQIRRKPGAWPRFRTR